MAILQGLSKHISLNAEKLRNHFVDFDGKKKIIVQRDNFIMGHENDWNGVYEEISGKIRGFIGKHTHDLLIPSFSTTKDLENQVFNVTLMDSLKSYFKYGMRTMCGIPCVKMIGSKNDWIALKNKVEELSRFDLEFWISKLLPILDKFIEAASGKVDKVFWDCCYKTHSTHGSGATTTVKGWVTLF